MKQKDPVLDVVEASTKPRDLCKKKETTQELEHKRAKARGEKI